MGPVLKKYYREKFMGIIFKHCENKEELTLHERRLYQKTLSMFKLKVILKWVRMVMEELERIRQAAAQKAPKGSLLGSFFSWGSRPEESAKKPTLKQELKQILDIIEEAKGDDNEGISLLECEFRISFGKIKLYQQVNKSKETVEFRYQGLHLNHSHCNNEDRVRFRVAGVEALSIGSNGGEVAKFIQVSDSSEDYLNCEINLSKKGHDFLTFIKINAVFFA